jgi:hypothetical protein
MNEGDSIGLERVNVKDDFRLNDLLAEAIN